MPFLSRAREIYMSTAEAEDTLGTAQALDSKIQLARGTFIRADPLVINNLDELGGFEEVTENDLIAKAYTTAFNSPRVKPHTLAAFASYALGVTKTSQPSGATNARKHRITPKLDDTELPTFTFEERKTSTIFRRYSGAGFADINLIVERAANRIVQLNSNVIAARRGAGAATRYSLVDESYLNGGSSGIWLAQGSTFRGVTPNAISIAENGSVFSGGTIRNITKEVNGINWGYNNNVNRDNLYTLDSDENFGVFERGAPTQTLNLDTKFERDGALEALEAQTEYALQWTVKGPEIEDGHHYGFNLIFPRLAYASLSDNEDNDQQVENATWQVLKSVSEIEVATGTDGATDADGTFTSASSTFTDGSDQVLPGDTVHVGTRSAVVTSVTDNNNIELGAGLTASQSSLNFRIVRGALPSVILEVFNSRTGYAA